ncbi:hypothetical protein [Bradyrhizobium pachyrhizi]|uniref:hypothetical protein n=1 Tax=Bradyrhizobium pachyrhizi TaxID=280333 RepID=UPI003D36938D
MQFAIKERFADASLPCLSLDSKFGGTTEIGVHENCRGFLKRFEGSRFIVLHHYMRPNLPELDVDIEKLA